MAQHTAVSTTADFTLTAETVGRADGSPAAANVPSQRTAQAVHHLCQALGWDITYHLALGRTTRGYQPVAAVPCPIGIVSGPKGLRGLPAPVSAHSLAQ